MSRQFVQECHAIHLGQSGCLARGKLALMVEHGGHGESGLCFEHLPRDVHDIREFFRGVDFNEWTAGGNDRVAVNFCDFLRMRMEDPGAWLRPDIARRRVGDVDYAARTPALLCRKLFDSDRMSVGGVIGGNVVASSNFLLSSYVDLLGGYKVFCSAHLPQHHSCPA